MAKTDLAESQSKAIDICDGCWSPEQWRFIRYARQHGTKRSWLVRLMERRPRKVAAGALANKIARMAWAVMVRGEPFTEAKLLLAT